MADHNDPNAVNSIFSDIDVSAADLYDIFGFPSDDTSAGEKVVIALTFAAVPQAGVLDSDMLYRILIAPDRRFVRSAADDSSLEGFLAYLESVKDKYLNILKPSEVRVTVDRDNRAHIRFLNFSGGSFSTAIETNQSITLQSPSGQPIKVFIGGRDDAFFNDLPGFFRSINYAPQFYHVPHTMPDLRELKIPMRRSANARTIGNSAPTISGWHRISSSGWGTSDGASAHRSRRWGWLAPSITTIPLSPSIEPTRMLRTLSRASGSSCFRS